MKNIIASLRTPNRYIVFKINKKLKKESLNNLINKLLKEQIGILGMAKADLKIIDSDNKKLILAVSPKYVNEAIFALSLSKDPLISPIGVSGILKKTKRFK